MDMQQTAHELWQRLISLAGSQSALARICGVKQPTVWRRLTLRAEVPAEWARAIHDELGVPLEDMRPDLWKGEKKELETADTAAGSPLHNQYD